MVSELTPEARMTAQQTIDGYRRTLARMKANALPGSVVDTVGIPRIEAEIASREEFIRCCDEYAQEKAKEMA